MMNNRIEVVSRRLLHCVGPVNTLTAEVCSEKRPPIHSCNHLFESAKTRNYLSYKGSKNFLKVSKFYIHFKNAIKNCQKAFGF